MTRTPPAGPLWGVTLLMSGILIMGSLIAYDLPAARMFAFLGGVTLPPLCVLHYYAGEL